MGYTGDIIALPKAELPGAVANGKCHGILERTRIADVMLAGGQPQILPVDGEEPYGCKLMAVGQPLVQLSAAFASDFRHCKNFVAEVVSAWLRGKREDATIARVMNEMVNNAAKLSNGELACSAKQSEVVPSASQRRLRAA